VTDPFDALREPVVPVAPDPSFTARLRDQLTRAVLTPGEPMAIQTTGRAPAWPPALTPYLVVSDARAARDWYVEVFAATDRGEPHVNPDGTIGHMEIGFGDAVLMFAEPSDLYPDVPVSPPDEPTTFSHSLRLEVPNVDETVVLARRRGAVVQREPSDRPYGRTATIVDPFGHRWLITTPPRHATRYQQGDIANITMVARDADRAKDFYEAVLQVPFVPGRLGSWNSPDIKPRFGVWSPPDTPTEVQLCYRVDDIEAAVARVRAAGGTAQAIEHEPYGLKVDCVDDQGANFQLWQPEE
jgi:uncharacterized glyoxalase superfamily protein PhnB